MRLLVFYFFESFKSGDCLIEFVDVVCIVVFDVVVVVCSYSDGFFVKFFVLCVGDVVWWFVLL